MRRRPFTVRAIALLGAGSAATHQLRYAIGYGSQASHALAAHPHGYLSLALPGILTALLIVIGGVFMRSAGGRLRGRHISPGFGSLWLACAFALALIYGTQETLEGSGAFVGSGWVGFALTIPIGLLAALCLRGADAAESLGVQHSLPRIAVAVVQRAMRAPEDVRVDSVMRPLSGRGPPALFVV